MTTLRISGCGFCIFRLRRAAPVTHKHRCQINEHIHFHNNGSQSRWRPVFTSRTRGLPTQSVVYCSRCGTKNRQEQRGMLRPATETTWCNPVARCPPFPVAPTVHTVLTVLYPPTGICTGTSHKMTHPLGRVSETISSKKTDQKGGKQAV